MASESPQESTARHQISNEMVQLMREWTGRGPTKTRTTIVDDLVIVRLEEVLLKAESRLVDADHGDAVLDMRRRFQLAMRESMVAIVERALGRKVVAFMSDQHFAPDIALEMFVLAPEDEHEAAGDQSDPRA